MTKGISLTIPLEQVTPEWIQGLEKLCHAHQGHIGWVSSSSTD
ncbi:MAG: hypothetical protein R2795_19200 [Saprospiraceae bacterium]